MQRVKAGIIGCGMISGIYLKNLTQVFDSIIEVAAVADLVPELARKRAEEFHIPVACSVDELLANPEIEIVVNLTAPAVHASINLQALHAGKHVHTEKPFALNREDAGEVIRLAESKGLHVGCAPDTFLGAGIQTCIKLIDDGWIGTPYAANATIIMGNPSDGMHPNFHNFPEARRRPDHGHRAVLFDRAHRHAWTGSKSVRLSTETSKFRNRKKPEITPFWRHCTGRGAHQRLGCIGFP